MKKPSKKTKTDYKKCPDCGGSSGVMGFKTGTVYIHGCLSCGNARGLHRSAKTARDAWKAYVDLKPGDRKGPTSRDKDFVQGACAALAAVVYEEGHSSAIKNALHTVGIYRLADFKKYGVCSYDKDLLKKAF